MFRDDLGNRIIFPGLFLLWSDGVNESDGTSVFWKCREVTVALDLKEEPVKFAADVSDGMLTFPQVAAEALSHGFILGSSEVWIIGGTGFDDMHPEYVAG